MVNDKIRFIHAQSHELDDAVRQLSDLNKELQKIGEDVQKASQRAREQEERDATTIRRLLRQTRSLRTRLEAEEEARRRLGRKLSRVDTLKTIDSIIQRIR